jgi:hypothetical protein
MNSVPVRKKYSVTMGNRIRTKDFRAPTRETPRMMRTPTMIFMLIALYSVGSANSAHVVETQESWIEPLICKTKPEKEKPRRGQENLRFVLMILMIPSESSPH